MEEGLQRTYNTLAQEQPVAATYERRDAEIFNPLLVTTEFFNATSPFFLFAIDGGLLAAIKKTLHFLLFDTSLRSKDVSETGNLHRAHAPFNQLRQQ